MWKDKLKKYEKEEYFQDIVWADDNKRLCELVERSDVEDKEKALDEVMNTIRFTIPIGYKEFASDDFPSITEFFQEEPYEHQKEIVEYLSRDWEPTSGGAHLPIDVVTGEYVNNVINDTFEDGEYSWASMLSYYVEKYNMRLPKCFENHILRKLEEERNERTDRTDAMLVNLTNYKEYGSDGPSMKDFFNEKSYEHQDEIASYLENNGTTLCVAGTYSKDAFTGEIIPLESNCILIDGKFAWDSSLPYYVRKYNLRLPKEFEDYVLSKERIKNL